MEGRESKEAENDQNRVKYGSLGQGLGAAMTRNVGYGMNRAGPCCHTSLVSLCGLDTWEFPEAFSACLLYLHRPLVLLPKRQACTLEPGAGGSPWKHQWRTFLLVLVQTNE